MKKIILLVAILFATNLCSAQLGAPTISVRDTLHIVSTYYNGAALNIEDWPSMIIVDDAVNITIANYTYKKGKPVVQNIYRYNSSWEGHIDYFKYDAVCNGKHENISIVRPREDCNSKTAKYIIGDYEFYVMNSADFLEFLLESK